MWTALLNANQVKKKIESKVTLAAMHIAYATCVCMHKIYNKFWGQLERKADVKCNLRVIAAKL